jgi:predicted PurR-regulated permease PerM
MPKKKSSFFKNIKSALNKKISLFGDTVKEIGKEKKARFSNANMSKKGLPKGEQRIAVDITSFKVTRAAIIVLLLVVLMFITYDIRGILLLFFVAFLLAAALDPLVDKMQDMKIPRSLSMLIIYIVIFFLIGTFATSVIGLVIEQVSGITVRIGELISNMEAHGVSIPFAEQLQPYIDQFYETVDVQAAFGQIQDVFLLVSEQLINFSIGLFNLLIVLTLAFFMTVEEKEIDDFFLSMFPERYGKYISTRMSAIKGQIGLWLRGQLFVSIVAAVISYIGLVLMGVEYAFILSVIAGISMVIPVIGRFVAWIVTFPIVFSQSPALSLWMSIYYLVVQQVENNFLVPYIMNKAVGLSPIVIIFAMMVGMQYLGIIGLILSIPIATTVAIFVKDYAKREK